MSGTDGAKAPTAGAPGYWKYARWGDQDFYLIETQISCINGLAAWFPLAHVFIPDESQIGYTEGALNPDGAEETARLMASARQLRDALQDCVWVMERELAGLQCIQPELRNARFVLAMANQGGPTGSPDRGVAPGISPTPVEGERK